MKIEQVKMLDGSTVEVKEITYGEWKTTRKESDEFDNKVALIRACTGLTVAQMEDLDVPEFNDLYRAANKVNSPEVEPKTGTSIIETRYPVINVMGESVTTVTISMPKLTAARDLSKLTDPDKRVEFMVKATTDLADLDGMMMCDYSLFVMAVPDFFALGVGYFQRNK